MMRKPAVLFLFLWLGISALGNIYYVSPAGSDQNSGYTINQPLKSISIAFRLVQPGDTIFLLKGTYPGQINLSDIHGLPEKPIVLMSHSKKKSDYAIIDGGAEPSLDLKKYGFELENCSWINFERLKFRNCWTDVVPMRKSTYISFINCDFKGGRRVIYPIGDECHHFLIENCFWEQDEEVWLTDYSKYETAKDWWADMHHEKHSFYNGALFHPWGTAGGFVFRGNTIKHAFNALRTRPSSVNQDANGEVYENTFINIRDNEFEPEYWAWNLHFYHNTMHNIHNAVSIHSIKGGGNIFIYGNTWNQDMDEYTNIMTVGFWKYIDSDLTYPCYIFNNSIRTNESAFQSTVEFNKQIKHFNNAYYFINEEAYFKLNYWDETFAFDYDCVNRPWPENIIENNQEKHGMVADPLFMNAKNGNFKLQANSPCINGGKVMHFKDFNWKQSYLGEAPDVGAYEGENRMEGPPFKYLEPPMEDGYDERPRIVRHKVLDNKLILYFSYDLDEASLKTSNLNVFAGDDMIKVDNIELDNDDRRKLFVSLYENITNDALSIFFDELPVGINGERATHWASIVPVKFPSK